MFTGIIEEIGKVKYIRKTGQQAHITIQFQKNFSDIALGESIAVNGVCLTVANFGEDYFSADVSEETLNRTNLGELKALGEVNLERALKVGERLGGHFVSGHIDGIGRIANKNKKGKDVLLTITAPEEILGGVVVKGSIAVDGISLTVASCDSKSFTMFIIPHTEASTNIRHKKAGDRVNLENDMIGKYIEKHAHLQSQKKEKNRGISNKFLAEHGFV